MPERRAQHDLGPALLPELLPNQIVVAPEVLDLDPHSQQQHLEQLGEVDGPEGAARDQADFVVGFFCSRRRGSMGVLVYRAAGVQDAFGRAGGAGGEEEDARGFGGEG